jgi:hypothetical protein
MKNRDTPGVYRYRSFRQEHLLSAINRAIIGQITSETSRCLLEKPQQRIEHGKHC